MATRDMPSLSKSQSQSADYGPKVCSMSTVHRYQQSTIMDSIEVPKIAKSRRPSFFETFKSLKKHVAKNEYKIDSFWKKFVRKGGRKLEYERNDDLISVEESDARIILFLIIFAFLIAIIATILTILYIIATNDSPLVKYLGTISNEVKVLNEKMSIPNLGAIYDNGTVVQVYFDKSINIAKIEKIIQLPRSKKYFMFSYQRSLYLLCAEAYRKMTKYHPTLNREGHEIVEKSDIEKYFAGWKLFDIMNAIQVP